MVIIKIAIDEIAFPRAYTVSQHRNHVDFGRLGADCTAILGQVTGGTDSLLLRSKADVVKFD